MKGTQAHSISCLVRACRDAFAILALLSLAACGGGGGSGGSGTSGSNQNSATSNILMSVTPRTISVTAATADPAPTATIQVNVTGLTQQQTVYVADSPTYQGIASVQQGPSQYLPATLFIQFVSPATLGPGTYKDTVQVIVCMDANCTTPVSNSPMTVQVTYTVTQSPFALASVSPASVIAGGTGFTLSVTGSSFTTNSKILWNGNALTTTFIDSTNLTAQIPASDIASAGVASITVSDPANGTSNAMNLTIGQYATSGLSPSSAQAGDPGFTLTVNGSYFTPQSSIQWNGNWRQTTFVSSSQLTTTIYASDIATAGTASVTVTDPQYGTTNAQTFTIQRPPLALSAISPSKVTVNGPSFTLTALGTGFGASSSIEWNNTALTTTYVSPTELTAQIPAADISATGTASVSVTDSTNSPVTTTTQTLNIVPASIDAVTLQMNPAHNGSVNFNALSLPSSAKWSADVGGTPSYPIIADGVVVVTVQLSGSSSEVVALDQASGNVAWGPILLGGIANATYENGQVFVLSGSDKATLQDFDIATGALNWSTTLNGRMVFTGAPTANDGTVYVDDENLITAVDETNGTVLWNVGADGNNLIPTLTPDGLYTTYYCEAYDLRPATGETIWTANTGCTGGGQGMAIVANQRDYTNVGGSYYGGDILDAGTGTSLGSYSASAPPAFSSTMGYLIDSGTLRAVKLADNSVQWTFTGDGNLAGAPVLVNQYVFIASSAGNLYALDATTGTQAWNVTLSAGIDTGVISVPYSQFAAGDGLLIVPSGTKVVAYTLSTSP